MKVLIAGKEYFEGIGIVKVVENLISDCSSKIATTVLMALESLRGKPDLLIYGFELSEVGFSGFDFVQKAKEVNPEIMSIIISDIDLECLGDIRAVGIYQLKRPLKREQVETVIREVLEDMEIASFQAMAGSRNEDVYQR